MVRFTFSLLAAALIAFGGYSALGHATGSAARPGLKVIATVVAHSHRHAAVSTARTPGELPDIQ
jgi:hypothetical protein